MTLLATLGGILILFLLVRSIRRRSIKQFPTPPANFLIGHLRAFTQGIPWLTLIDWSKDYGDIYQLSVVGQPILILNKAEDAHILLDKRGANYSDRLRTVLAGEIAGQEYFTGFVRYGDDFRTLRRYTSQNFNSRDHLALYPYIHEQVKILLNNLLVDSGDFEPHLNRFSAAIMVKSTYGHEIQSNDDRYIKLAAEAFEAVNSLGLTGMTTMDLIPILKYLPSWVPGMDVRKRAEEIRPMMEKMSNEPYEQVKTERKRGLEKPSLVDSLLERCEKTGGASEKEEFLIKNAAAQIYGAGVETSADLILTTIFEMIHHPEVARKAQEEMSRVLGDDQLPTLNDRPDLPYIDCILKEVMRINPPAPLAIPHLSMEEDVYKGKTIPARTAVIPNVWAMTRDESLFPNPELFDPDRFLEKIKHQESVVHQLNTFDSSDPASVIFGFGRRICPGRYLADASAWLVIADMLAVFNIEPVIDKETGKKLLPEFGWANGGLTAKLNPFEARFVPRNEKMAHLVSQE